MGNNLSQAEKRKLRLEKNGRFYRPPDARQKDRFDPEEDASYASQNDASIDKVSISSISDPVANSSSASLFAS
jgi:hypothetical protein